jgi:hypothetical protein
MSPIVLVIFTLLRQLDPGDIKKLVAEIVGLIDPIIATKGVFVRAAWSVLKGVLVSFDFASALRAKSGLSMSWAQTSAPPDHPDMAAVVEYLRKR